MMVNDDQARMMVNYVSDVSEQLLIISLGENGAIMTPEKSKRYPDSRVAIRFYPD